MTVRVACYGTLMAGFGNGMRLMQNAQFIGECTLKGRMYSLGAYPYVSTHGDDTVHAELYEIDERTLQDLDRLEGHPDFYQREIVETSLGPAWVYLINNDQEFESCNVVRSGSWRQHVAKPREHFGDEEWVNG